MVNLYRLHLKKGRLERRPFLPNGRGAVDSYIHIEKVSTAKIERRRPDFTCDPYQQIKHHTNKKDA